VLPDEWPSLKQPEDIKHALVILKEAISSDLNFTWQYNRKQGLYEEINILRQTIKVSEPKPVIILL
jgi:hypothetical protein